MVRQLMCLFLALIAPLAAGAQCVGDSFLDRLSSSDLTALEAQAAATPFGEGLFWTATKGDTRLTLIGTMHLPDPRHAALVQRADPLWESADLLLVEATLEDQQAMQVYMASDPSLMTITTGPTLPERLSPEQWDAIAEAAADRNIPGFMAAKMQPWFLTMSLSIPPCTMIAMASGELGLDSLLMENALARGIPVAPLEPWQEMFALLTAGTFEEQVEALQMALLDVEVHETLMVALKDLYFSEDVAMTWHMTNFTKDLLPNIDAATFDAQMAELERLLLEERNAAWIPVIEQAATQHDDIVVAFGAAHLIGEIGVLTLLEHAGWAIEPY